MCPPNGSFAASPAPGQSTVKIGRYEFTSAFDSGNATGWCREADKADGAEVYSARVARDCEGQKNAHPKAFWFYFGVRFVGEPPAEGSVLELVIRGMSYQCDLYENGYAPLVRSASSSQRWVRDTAWPCSFRKEAQGETFELRWRHKFSAEDLLGTTFFAFCHPFSTADLSSYLMRLDHLTCDEGGGEELFFLDDRLHHDHVPTLGRGVYYHRETLTRSALGHPVELLTVTAASASKENWPRNRMETFGQQGIDLSVDAAVDFDDRHICFVSARVHPGETSGQFAFLGFLQFVLSDDPRAEALRSRFVFKLAPMLNPDGVFLGHSRTDGCGVDLNRCYRDPNPLQHSPVHAVRERLLQWAADGRLLYYLDCHGHSATRGCFLYANKLQKEDDMLWNTAYLHAAQVNCPHFDIDVCRFDDIGDKKPVAENRPGGYPSGANSAGKPATSNRDSGRAQIGALCELVHCYTLECNYNMGRLVRPVADAPGLGPEAARAQAVRVSPGVERSNRFAPVPYDTDAWVAVGEALAVALLDLRAHNPHSRLIGHKPLQPSSEAMRLGGQVTKLLQGLATSHRGDGQWRWEAWLRRNRPSPGEGRLVTKEVVRTRSVFEVVHKPMIVIRSEPSTTAKAKGYKPTGDKIVVLAERADGWVQVAPEEESVKGDAYALIDGKPLGFGLLLRRTSEVLEVIEKVTEVERQVLRLPVPSLKDVLLGEYR